MTRVLQLITRMNIGGPARHVVHLATELGERFEIDVVAGRSPDEEGTFEDPRVSVQHVDLVRAPSPFRDLHALVQVWRRLRHGRYDVVHTHMAKAGTIGRLAALLTRPRPRTVHTFHGHVLEGYFSPMVEKAVLGMERWLAPRTDVLVAVSEQTRDELLALGIGRGSQWRVVRPASDLAPFLAVEATADSRLRRQHGIAESAFVVAVLGRLAPIKDHATLVRAVAATDAHLLVAGEGPLAGDLRQLSTELDAGDRIHFLGWSADVPALLAQVDAVALTSRNEGTPLALVEAQAAGLPVLATDVGGVRDIVEHGSTGLLVAPNDHAAVAEAIRRLQSEPTLRRRFGEAGRQRAQRRYGSGVAVKQIRAIYTELAHAPSGSPAPR